MMEESSSFFSLFNQHGVRNDDKVDVNHYDGKSGIEGPTDERL